MSPHPRRPPGSVADEPEFLRYDQGVIADRERGVAQNLAHLGRMPEPLMDCPPFRYRGEPLAFRTDVTETDTLVVPGDFSSAVSRVTGNPYTVTLPGGGLLIHDVGNFTFAPDGSVLQDHGPKMLFFGQTDKLCAALD